MYTPKTVDYVGLSNASAASQSQERQAAMSAQANVASQALATQAQGLDAKFKAQAQIAGAEAGAEATRMEGIMGGLSSLASGFSALGGGAVQKASDYTNKVDFGGGKSMMANNNGRLFHQNFQFGVPGK